MMSASTAHEVRLLSDKDVQRVGLTVLEELSKRGMLFVFDFATKTYIGASHPEGGLVVCKNGPSVQVNCDTSK